MNQSALREPTAVLAEAPYRDLIPPRRFWLLQQRDESVTRIVAEGAVWSSGYVALHWPGQPVVTSSWTSLDQLLAAYQHDGWTTLEWIDKYDAEHRETAWVEYDGGAIWIH